MDQKPRPSYKKVIITGAVAVAVLTGIAIFSGSATDQSVQNASVAAPPTQQVSVPNTFSQVVPTVQNSSNLSNDNYYKNVDGNTVHSPAYSDSVPTGATARCRDGTYSFSQHRSGTCSRHGGVESWL